MKNCLSRKLSHVLRFYDASKQRKSLEKKCFQSERKFNRCKKGIKSVTRQRNFQSAWRIPLNFTERLPRFPGCGSSWKRLHPRCGIVLPWPNRLEIDFASVVTPYQHDSISVFFCLYFCSLKPKDNWAFAGYQKAEKFAEIKTFNSNRRKWVESLHESSGQSSNCLEWFLTHILLRKWRRRTTQTQTARLPGCRSDTEKSNMIFVSFLLFGFAALDQANDF